VGFAIAASQVHGSAYANAANIPDPDIEQRRQKEREDAMREQLERSRDVRLAPPVAPIPLRLPAAETPCFKIDRIVLAGELSKQFGWLVGDTGLDPRHILTSNPLNGIDGDDSPVGRCLGTQGIDLVLRRLQNALVEKGYVTTRVLVAPQDLKSGTLTITLVPGRIRSIHLAPGNSNRVTLWNALPFGHGDLLNLRDIEQALENLKRSPTVEAEIQIVPAEDTDKNALTDSSPTNLARPGDSDLIITCKQALPARLNLGFDDSGSRTTGKHMANGTLSLDNPLMLNDLFYVNSSRSTGHILRDSNGEANHIFGGTAPGSRENSSETVHYQVPYGYWLLAATASRNRYHQTVAGTSQDYTYRGTGDYLEVKLSRLVYRDASNKSTVSIKGFRRGSYSYLSDVEIENQRRVEAGWELGLDHMLLFSTPFASASRAVLDISVAFRKGTGAFGAQPAPEETYGEGTSRFKITTFDTTLQLPIEIGSQRFSYLGAFKGQYNGIPFVSNTPLTSIDQIAIGGRYTIRGFNGERYMAGNRGCLWRNDLSWNLEMLGLRGQSIYAAIDAGWVGGNVVQWQPKGWLVGTAFGCKGYFPVWGLPEAAYRGLTYDIFLGMPVYKPDHFQTARLTGGFSISMAF